MPSSSLPGGEGDSSPPPVGGLPSSKVKGTRGGRRELEEGPFVALGELMYSTILQP